MLRWVPTTKGGQGPMRKCFKWSSSLSHTMWLQSCWRLSWKRRSSRIVSSKVIFRGSSFGSLHISEDIHIAQILHQWDILARVWSDYDCYVLNILNSFNLQFAQKYPRAVPLEFLLPYLVPNPNSGEVDRRLLKVLRSIDQNNAWGAKSDWVRRSSFNSKGVFGLTRSWIETP